MRTAIIALVMVLGAALPASAQTDHTAHGGTDTPGQSGATGRPPPVARPADLPAPTDEDRHAAFPDVSGHTAHDSSVRSLTVVDQFEWRSGADTMHWSSHGWVGGDRDRLWFRTEGRSASGGVQTADLHLLYGRVVWRWWDVVAGVRQDVRPGSPQAWLAVGIQGAAPGGIDVEATGYLGAYGITAARGEARWDLLLTNRLVLQGRAEVNIYGTDDPARGYQTGLTELETGLRLRFEIRREIAPYVGVSFMQQFGAGRVVSGAADELTASVGLRVWF